MVLVSKRRSDQPSLCMAEPRFCFECYIAVVSEFEFEFDFEIKYTFFKGPFSFGDFRRLFFLLNLADSASDRTRLIAHDLVQHRHHHHHHHHRHRHL